VVVCIGRNISDINCIDNSKLPGNKSSGGKPGEKLKNGVSKDLILTESVGVKSLRSE
jgi:hypothetical protein